MLGAVSGAAAYLVDGARNARWNKLWIVSAAAAVRRTIHSLSSLPQTGYPAVVLI